MRIRRIRRKTRSSRRLWVRCATRLLHRRPDGHHHRRVLRRRHRPHFCRRLARRSCLRRDGGWMTACGRVSCACTPKTHRAFCRCTLKTRFSSCIRRQSACLSGTCAPCRSWARVRVAGLLPSMPRGILWCCTGRDSPPCCVSTAPPSASCHGPVCPCPARVRWPGTCQRWRLCTHASTRCAACP